MVYKVKIFLKEGVKNYDYGDCIYCYFETFAGAEYHTNTFQGL